MAHPRPSSPRVERVLHRAFHFSAIDRRHFARLLAPDKTLNRVNRLFIQLFSFFFFLNVHHRIILFLKDYFDKYYPTRFYFEFILTLEKTLENSGEKEEYTYIERNIENQLMLEGTKFGNTKT